MNDESESSYNYFPAVVDATMLNNFRNCARKFELSDVEDWKGRGQNVHLHAGMAFAAGLEETRKAFYVDENDSDTALARGLHALILKYGDFIPEPNASGEQKTLERMCGALEFYFAEWPLDAPHGAKPHVMPSGKRAIEFSFAEPLGIAHPITGDPIIYCGRSDMIADFADGVYIEDDKTASQLGESWTKQWDLRSQFTGYCWAAARAGIGVNGVLVRGVSILKTKYGRADAITYRSKWEIDRWEYQVCRDLRRAIECWREGYWDFALDDACNNYGGCQFREICKSQNPQEWLPMSFERRRWNPLERTETLLCVEEKV